MVSFFLSRVALAMGFRQHWVSSLLVGILAWKGDRESLSFTRAGQPLSWIPRSRKDLKSAGHLTAFPEAQARPLLALGGGIVQFGCLELLPLAVA